MVIASAKNGNVIAPSAWVAKSFLQRLLGLMFRASVKEGEAVVFYNASSIHMFFMRCAIDVLFLDTNRRVKKIVRTLRPWQMSGCFGACTTIEFGAGALPSDLSVGDGITITEA